jgi:hypothetical protein
MTRGEPFWRSGVPEGRVQVEDSVDHGSCDRTERRRCSSRIRPDRVHIRLVVVGLNHGSGAAVAVASDGEGVYTGQTLRIPAR